MTRLGAYGGAAVVRAFEKAGWVIARKTRGSHVILTKTGRDMALSVPVHSGKTVKRGTLRSLIRDAGMSVDEFIRLL